MMPYLTFVEVSPSSIIWGITRTYPAGTRDHFITRNESDNVLMLETEQVPIDGIRLMERSIFSMRCCKDCRADFLDMLKSWANGQSSARMERMLHEADVTMEGHTGAFIRENGTLRKMTEAECVAFEQERGHPPVKVTQD